MKVYQLTAQDKFSGDLTWDFNPIFSTLEKAQKQMQSEIDGYTKVNGVVQYECPYNFTITEIEVQ